jgi:hypothetical protein
MSPNVIAPAAGRLHGIKGWPFAEVMVEQQISWAVACALLGQDRHTSDAFAASERTRA